MWNESILPRGSLERTVKINRYGNTRLFTESRLNNITPRSPSTVPISPGTLPAQNVNLNCPPLARGWWTWSASQTNLSHACQWGKYSKRWIKYSKLGHNLWQADTCVPGPSVRFFHVLGKPKNTSIIGNTFTTTFLTGLALTPSTSSVIDHILK